MGCRVICWFCLSFSFCRWLDSQSFFEFFYETHCRRHRPSEDNCPPHRRLRNTVKPVYNGPVYSGHPLYNGHWTTSQKSSLIFPVKLTCIKRSPVYNGRGHPLDFLNVQFHYLLPVYNGHEIGFWLTNNARDISMTLTPTGGRRSERSLWWRRWWNCS